MDINLPLPVLIEHTRTYMQHPNLNVHCVRKSLHLTVDCINTQTFIISLGCTSVSMAPAKRHSSGLRTWQDIYSVTLIINGNVINAIMCLRRSVCLHDTSTNIGIYLDTNVNCARYSSVNGLHHLSVTQTNALG